MTEIRLATPADARAIAEVQIETWRATYREVFPQSVLDSLDIEAREQMWRRAPANPDTCVFVAEGHGRVVGFAAVGPARGSEGDGELYSIYVLPSEWDTGTGRALMEAAVEWLAARYAEAILWVAARNPRARRFYEAGSWVADAERTDVLEGVEVDEVRYRLSGLDRL